MGKTLAKPPMVELIGNEKALWELTFRYCSDWSWTKRSVLKVVNRVKNWHGKDFRFVLIPDPRIEHNFEVYLARRKTKQKKLQDQTNPGPIKNQKSMESQETLELNISAADGERRSTLLSSTCSDDINSFVGIPFRMPSAEQTEGVADLDNLNNDNDNELYQKSDEEDVNNGAILVHGSSSGKPDLDLFMETLEGAMVKCEDPEYMAKVSARYIESRKSKMI